MNNVKAILLHDDELDFYIQYVFENSKWRFNDLLSLEDINEQIAILGMQPIYKGKYSETEIKTVVGEELYDLLELDSNDNSIYTIYKVYFKTL